MADERIIEKVKKLLELSKNNPNENEAMSAALKAQEMLAKYHLSMADVEDINLDKIEDIKEVAVSLSAHAWKYALARVIAPNFRCKHYYYGKQKVVFYGYETDAKIAAETFEYLFKVGNKLAAREQQRAKNQRLEWEGVFNAFAIGFVEGVKAKLEEQCTALMIVVPQEVNDAYAEKAKGFRTMHTSGATARRTSVCEEAREHGRFEGSVALGGKYIK